MQKICEMERRTLVLRKVPPTTTTVTILKDLQRQFTRPLGEIVEAVVREPLDRRRFYVRFHTVDLKRECAKQGFQIGDINIPPQQSDTQGQIPDVPHYLDREDVLNILSRFGDVVKGEFDRFEDTNVRCGIFRFDINLHPHQKLPSTIQILNDKLTIHTKDDLLQCTYCDKYGHRIVHCLRKKEDLARKAEKELIAQMNDPHQTADADMEQEDDQTTDDVPPTSLQQSNQTPTPENNTSTGLDPRDDDESSYASSEEERIQSTPNTLPQTSDQLYTTPTVSTQPINFVSGGDLATGSSDSYQTPTQPRNLTPHEIAEDQTFYATEDDNPFHSVTFKDMRREEYELTAQHHKELFEYYNPEQKDITHQFVQNIQQAAVKQAEKLLTDKYHSLYEQYCAVKVSLQVQRNKGYKRDSEIK